MSFDARSAKLLQAGEHLTSDEHPGLRLEASASRKAWIYRYRSPVDGRLRQIKIGLWPAMSVHSAVAAWEKLKGRRDAGEDPAEEARAEREARRVSKAESKAESERAGRTVFAVADAYWRGHVKSSRAKKGSTEIRRMFDKMLGDTGGIPAHELTRAQAFDLIQRWAEVAPVQAAKLRSELGAAWDYAYDAGRLPETVPNWWRLILRGRIRSKGKKIAGEKIGVVKRVLSPEEVGALIRWLPNFTPLVAEVLTMYLWTATRGAEIVGMRGDELTQEGNLWWWTVPKARTKNARHAGATDLRVPLFGRAREVALRRREAHGAGPLFPARLSSGEVRPVEQKTIQSRVWMHQPYSKTRPEAERPRLPVTRWAPHDLRRTSRTLLAALGCPDAVGEAILGHMLPGVMGTYNRHAYDSERAEWLKKLADHLEALAAG